MGKASITIAIGGEYTGSKALKQAQAELRALRDTARDMGGATSGIMKFGDSMVDFGSNMEYTGKKIEAEGVKITKMTAPITALGAASVKLAADYENSVSKVYTIMDKGVMSTEEMSRSILDLSTATGKSADELADATYQALSASIETGKVAGFVSDAVKLAKVGFTDTASAVDILTTTINAYGYSAEDAAMITGRLVQTQNKGKTTVNELASSLGNVIPTASAYNVSLDNLCSAYVVMTKQGINTANATTAINGMLTELANEGSTVAQILKDETGQSFGQLMESGMSLGDVIQLLSKHVDGNSEAFANLWGNVRASKGALAIANAGAGEFTTAMNDMADSAGLVDAALEDLATPASKANKAINAVKNTAIDLGEQIIGAALPTIEDLASGAKDLYNWFKNLDEGTKQNIVRIGGFVAAAGPAITIFGKLYGGVGKLVTGLGKGLQTIGSFSAAMKVAEKEMTDTGAASVTFGQKFSAAATKVGALTKATNLLKGALPAIGIAAAIALISKIASAISEWRQHTELVSKATTGLKSAVSEAAAAYKESSGAIDKAAASTSSYAKTAQECLEAQAQLAESQRTAWQEYGANAAMVDAYAQQIAELTEKERLSEQEQAKLKLAVEGFNDATGSSISIIDAQTGELSEQRDAILATAEAYKYEARMQALREMYKDTVKQQIENELALREATKDLARAKEELNSVSGMGYDVERAYIEAVDEQQRKVDELSAANESAKDTLNTYLEMMADGIPTYDDFNAALAESGVAMEDFGAINEEQLAKLQSGFDGTLASIVKTCSSEGIKIPDSLAKAINSKSADVDAASANIRDTAVNGIAATPSLFGSTGAQAASGFAGAIGSASAYGEGQSLAQSGKSGMESVSAYGAGSNFSSTFASGMGSVDVFSAAYRVGTSALSAIKNALGIASPSKEAGYVSDMFIAGAVNHLKKGEKDVDAEIGRISDLMTLRPSLSGPFGFGGMFATPSMAAAGYGAQGGSSAQNVTNIYNIGDVTLDASSLSSASTLEEFVELLIRAKKSNESKARRR